MNVLPKIYFWARVEFVGRARNIDWRPDFFYPDHPGHGYMIWPIVEKDGLGGFGVFNPEFWEKVHQFRVSPGVQFELRESTHLIARGTVVRIEK